MAGQSARLVGWTWVFRPARCLKYNAETVCRQATFSPQTQPTEESPPPRAVLSACRAAHGARQGFERFCIPLKALRICSRPFLLYLIRRMDCNFKPGVACSRTAFYIYSVRVSANISKYYHSAFTTSLEFVFSIFFNQSYYSGGISKGEI